MATNSFNVFKMALTLIRKSPQFSSHLKFLLLFYSEEVFSESPVVRPSLPEAREFGGALVVLAVGPRGSYEVPRLL